MERFRAYVVREKDGKFTGRIEEKDRSELPEGDVLIKVRYSSVNYKDALSASGNKAVTRNYPHTPGVDAAGMVVESKDDRFSPGQTVVVNGFDFGMNTSGGFQEYIRVPVDWVTPLPSTLSAREAMILGTAGLTAAQSVDELLRTIAPKDGPVLVTGATGGVGSVAVALLHRTGFTVHAVSGKAEAAFWVGGLGAGAALGGDGLLDVSWCPLVKGGNAGGLDTVGGPLLASALKRVRYGGVVTACGNVGGAEFTTTVYPFILRGVRLIGIDSVQQPIAYRERLLKLLGQEWRLPKLDEMAEIRPLDALPEVVGQLLAGTHRGRTVIAF